MRRSSQSCDIPLLSGGEQIKQWAQQGRKDLRNVEAERSTFLLLTYQWYLVSICLRKTSPGQDLVSNAANILDTMLPRYLASSGRSWQIWEDNSQTLITILSLVTEPQSIGAETWYTETCNAWTFAEHNYVWHKKLLKTLTEVTQLCGPRRKGNILLEGDSWDMSPRETHGQRRVTNAVNWEIRLLTHGSAKGETVFKYQQKILFVQSCSLGSNV